MEYSKKGENRVSPRGPSTLFLSIGKSIPDLPIQRGRILLTRQLQRLQSHLPIRIGNPAISFALAIVRVHAIHRLFSP